MIKITKIETHIVRYIDQYEISEQDLEAIGSVDDLIEDHETLQDFRVDTIVDDVSNRNGDYEQQWFLNGEEIYNSGDDEEQD